MLLLLLFFLQQNLLSFLKEYYVEPHYIREIHEAFLVEARLEEVRSS